MKKILAILAMCCLLLTAACVVVPVEEPSLKLSEVAETYTAELGERFDIPEVTATVGEMTVEVTVTVKTVSGEDVELQGRGTRFIAEKAEGYVITYSATYGEESVQKTVTVTVSDKQGPKVDFEETVDNMTVKIGQTVSVPAPVWTDASGEVLNASYAVTFNGNPVDVTAENTFVAESYGDYVITYTAEDILGNKTERVLTVSCARTILLEDFEAMDTVWADPSCGSIVSENAVEGNALKVNCNNDWQLVAIYPQYYDLSGFDKFQITIYSTAALDTSDQGFYILNQKYTLSEGKNVITISKEEFQAQYPNGKIPSTTRPEYYAAKYLWCQVKGASGTLYIDNFVGIFDNYETDTVAPVIDFGKGVFFDEITVNEGRTFVLPTATAYDNSMENVTVQTVLTNKAGEDITEAAANGTYTVLGNEEYTLAYTATDSSGNTSQKTVAVEIAPKTTIPDITAAEYFPANRIYDVLQDFEGVGMSWTQIENSYEAEHVMSGEKSLRLSTPNADTCVVLTLTKDGVRLETADWEKYEYIQVYVYADSENARFDFYGNLHYLELGPNVIKITPAEIIAEIAKASNVYDAMGGFYFQLTNGTVFVDSVIAVYPEGYVPEEKPDAPFEPEKPDAIKNYFPTDKKYDVLQSFDEAGCVDTWFSPDSEGITATNAVKGNAFRIQGTADWFKLPVMIKKNGNVLTEADWAAYERFKLAMCSKNACKFAFLNHVFDLTAGWNVIEISAADMLKQINANADCYPATGWFWCQVTGAADLYFDELIGICKEGATEPEEPDVPVEPEKPDAIKNYFPTDKKYEVLQSFDEAGSVDTWFFPESTGVTAANAVKGNAFRVQGEANWSKLPVMIKKNGQLLTEADWASYESFKMAIYSEKACTFAFLNHIFDLTAGWNVIEISAADMLKQITSNADCYPATGWFWCQLNGSIDVYVDELIGICKEGATEPEEPDVPAIIKDYFPTENKYDVLQSFDENTAVDPWSVPNSEGAVAANAVKGKAYRVIKADSAWTMLQVVILKDGNVLTEADWKAYESFKMAIYSANACNFAFLNHIYDLTAGWNVVEISSEDMLKQIAANANCYLASGHFWCQINGNVDIYLDELIGIYAATATEPEAPVEPEVPAEPALPEALKGYYPTGKSYDVLQSFDENTAIDPWSVPNSEGVTTANAVKGKAYRVIKADSAWTMLQVVMLKNGNVLTEADWKAYESFKIAIYSVNACEFYFLNKAYVLTAGWNVVEISSADMIAQINSNANCYLASGHFWCQINGNVDIYLDELIGIYPAQAE